MRHRMVFEFDEDETAALRYSVRQLPRGERHDRISLTIRGVVHDGLKPLIEKYTKAKATAIRKELEARRAELQKELETIAGELGD